jgi:hypothetical protein
MQSNRHTDHGLKEIFYVKSLRRLFNLDNMSFPAASNDASEAAGTFEVINIVCRALGKIFAFAFINAEFRMGTYWYYTIRSGILTR